MTDRGKPELRRTEDFAAIRALALSSGLEDGTFESVVTAYGFFLGDELVGCAALKKDGTRFAVEWLAVKEGMRGKGLGAMLVGRIEIEARARGADRLWALARAPDFFEKIGYIRVGAHESGGPTLTNCMLCSQYQRNCFPAIVAKKL